MNNTGINFTEATANKDPYIQFRLWYDENLEKSSLPYPDSFTLASADNSGKVSARTVLLKDHGPGGFVFFTNYESKKGWQLSENPSAAMLFYWPELSRQVRIEGKALRVEETKSEEYFSSRPYESRIGAWASRQSEIIPDRNFLDNRYAEFDSEYRGKKVPRPKYWGGYRIIPSYFEFWQEGKHRLHDRIIYIPGNAGWIIKRISP